MRKKGYIARKIKRDDLAMQLQHITCQPIKQLFHAVDNNILQNLTVLQEYVRTDEDIYRHRIPHLKGKTVRRDIQLVDPVKITSFPKTILNYYKDVTILCDLVHINVIGFLNTISGHIMFATTQV